MIASFQPAGAAEFPNDNPALHRGARWVCAAPLGAPRALWRATGEGANSALPNVPSAPRLDGPIQLDLHRIVLAHRVENVPPPPDFIYRPFVSARSEPPAPSPIEPRPCRVVDTRQAGQRVQRGWRVDVAPCVHVGAGERRSSRHRGMLSSSFVAPPLATCPAARLPSAEPQPELQAASA